MNYLRRKKILNRKTWLFVTLFVLAIAAVIAVTNVIVVGIAAFIHTLFYDSYGYVFNWQYYVLVVSLMMMGVVMLAIYMRKQALSGGGKSVAERVRAKRLERGRNDFYQKRLLNVVEEMAIAAGIPVPNIYILKREQAINAFAAGFSPSDAVIVVTDGALTKLNRDELQAVIGHEVSHIVNGDIALNIQLLCLLAGITLFTDVGSAILMVSSNLSGASRDSVSNFAVGFVSIFALFFFMIGWVGSFFSNLIKLCVNRQLELMADASAVRYTRNRDALVSALCKIAGIEQGSHIRNPAINEVNHFLFGDSQKFMSLFATHPTILERIKAIAPRYDMRQFSELKNRWQNKQPDGYQEDIILGFAEAKTGAAHNIEAALGEKLVLAARNDYCVVPLLFALLLSHKKNVSVAEIDYVETHFGKTIALTMRAFLEDINAKPAARKIDLLFLLFPGLQHMRHDKLSGLGRDIQEVIKLDKKCSLFEYCLSTLVTQQMNEVMQPDSVVLHGEWHLSDVKPQVSLLLAVLAEYGHERDADCKHAYALGMNVIFSNDVDGAAYQAHVVTELDDVWQQLNLLAPDEKEKLIEAMQAVMNADQQQKACELDLIKTVRAKLHCQVIKE